MIDPTCPLCGGTGNRRNTRINMRGEARIRLRCKACTKHWTLTEDGHRAAPRGHKLSASVAVLDFLHDHPGAMTREVAQLFRTTSAARQRLQFLAATGRAITKLGKDGNARHWHADHAAMAEAWVNPPPPPPAAPAPPPPARYVGAIVPHRPTPPSTPERVEWRQMGGQLVRVTIGPSAIEQPAARHIFTPPPTRAMRAA